MGSTITTSTLVAPYAGVNPTAFGVQGYNFSWGEHICAIFDDVEQQMAVMLPFVIRGLCAAQRCVWIAPPSGAERFQRGLASAGADLSTLAASGQLVVISDIDFYLRDGLFDPVRTLQLGSALIEDSRREGWGGVRVAAEAAFLGAVPLDVQLWETYEAQVTRCLAGAPLVAVCQYRRRRVPGAFVDAALRTHQTVLLGETVCQRPFPAPDVVGAIGPWDVS